MVVEYRYLDVIWLDNLVMNFIILWTVKKVSRNNTRLWRLWASAVIGAFYAVSTILPAFELFNNFWIKILFSVIIVLAAYKTIKLDDFIKLIGLFYLVNFIFGGAALGIYYFFDSSLDIKGGAFYIKSFPVKILVFSSVFVIIACRSLWPLIKAKLDNKNFYYTVELIFDDSSVVVEALMDTGNELIDPITHKPVMIVQFNKIKSIMPDSIKRIYMELKEENLDYITEAVGNSPWVKRFRMIPYKAVGKANGILIAYKPDKIRVLIGETWEEIKDVLVAVYNKELSTNNDYHAVINPQIIPQ